MDWDFHLESIRKKCELIYAYLEGIVENSTEKEGKQVKISLKKLRNMKSEMEYYDFLLNAAIGEIKNLKCAIMYPENFPDLVKKLQKERDEKEKARMEKWNAGLN